MDTIKLEYETEGRSGSIIVHVGAARFSFWWEFGTGDTVVFISIPDAAHWEAQTGRPLEERLPILHFIGARVVADKAPGCTYKLSDHWLEIVRR